MMKLRQSVEGQLRHVTGMVRRGSSVGLEPVLVAQLKFDWCLSLT